MDKVRLEDEFLYGNYYYIMHDGKKEFVGRTIIEINKRQGDGSIVLTKQAKNIQETKRHCFAMCDMFLSGTRYVLRTRYFYFVKSICFLRKR